MIRLIDLLKEGVYDPGILKCVFMAGGPGSGKSTIAKELLGIGGGLSSVSVGGLKNVNSDTAFEATLKKNGIDPKELANIEKENPELFKHITEDPNGIRAQAKKTSNQIKAFYEAGRLGMIVDGTGDDYGKIKTQKEKAESLGYDTFMVFVNTSLEVALARNRARDRVLPDSIVTDIWKACQENLGKFQGLFSGRFRIIDNSSSAKLSITNTTYKGTQYKTEARVASDVQKAAADFAKEPIRNAIGKNWVQTQLILKNANVIK